MATDIEGCRMLVQPGVNGLLVPRQNVTALADALARILGEASLREQMGRASHDMVVREFSEDRILDQYEGLYKRLRVIR